MNQTWSLETLLVVLTVLACALQTWSCVDAYRRWSDGRAVAHPAAVELALRQLLNGVRRVVYSAAFIGLACHLWLIPPPPPLWEWRARNDVLVLLWLLMAAATSAYMAVEERRTWRALATALHGRRDGD